jgi:hypothetical protein
MQFNSFHFHQDMFCDFSFKCLLKILRTCCDVFPSYCSQFPTNFLVFLSVFVLCFAFLLSAVAPYLSHIFQKIELKRSTMMIKGAPRPSIRLKLGEVPKYPFVCLTSPFVCLIFFLYLFFAFFLRLTFHLMWQFIWLMKLVN